MINLDSFSGFQVKDILSLKTEAGAKNIHVSTKSKSCVSLIF